MKTRSKLLVVGVAITFMMTGCVTVEEYQKVYLYDKDMSLADKKIESFEINYQAYREGVAGANGGKVGGGCGCN